MIKLPSELYGGDYYFCTKKEFKKMNIACFKILEDYCQPGKALIASPQKYIQMGLAQEGRGDASEALIARLHINQHKDRLDIYTKLYADDLIIQEVDNNYVELRRKSSIYSGIYCFYSKVNNLVTSSPNQAFRYPSIEWLLPKNLFEFTVDKKIFKDFCADKNENKKVRIFDCVSPEKMKDLLCEAISRKSTVAQCHSIRYLVKETGYWECPEYRNDTFLDFPYELYYKRKKFKYQREYRIVFPHNIFNFTSSYKSKLISLNQPLETLHEGNLYRDGKRVVCRVWIPYSEATVHISDLYNSNDKFLSALRIYESLQARARRAKYPEYLAMI